MSRNSQTLSKLERARHEPVAQLHPGAAESPSRLILGHAIDHPGPHHYEPHTHDWAQLLYATEGVMSVVTAQGTWVVPPQQAVWIPAGVVHEVRSPETLAMRTLKLHPEVAEGLPTTCRVWRVSALLREMILRIVTFDAAAPLNAAEARLLAVVPDELRALPAEPLHLPLPRDPRLRRIAEALMADPGDNAALADWARRVGGSERTLARLFQKEVGLTFGRWRQRLRLVTAVSRLAEGSPVTTVAYDLGYDSPSAFIAMFRRQLGQSPGRYLAGGESA